MARDDASDRKGFREEVKENIEAGKSPSFQALTDGEGGAHDWKMGTRMPDGSIQSFGPSGFHSNEGAKPGWLSTDWDAGHTKSSASGENLYSIEDRAKNRSDGATLEKAGGILEKPAVQVEGLSVNQDFAQSMEDKGLLKPGTVESAPTTPGWSKESGLLYSTADQSQNSAAQSLSSEVGKQSSTDQATPLNWSQSPSNSLDASPSQAPPSSLGSNSSDASTGLSSASPSGSAALPSSPASSSSLASPSTSLSDTGSSSFGNASSSSSSIGGSTSVASTSPSGSTSDGGATSASSASTSASTSSSSTSSGTSSST